MSDASDAYSNSLSADNPQEKVAMSRLINDYNTLKTSYETLVREYRKVLSDNEALNAIINTVVAHDSLMENQLDDELQKARYQAGHDPLTQLYNRQSFHDFIDRAIKKSEDAVESIALIMLDIDHFKMINDTYGHGIGDEVLVAVTRCIKRILPDSCTFSRWGGEEFMVLLMDFTSPQAFNLAEYLRISVEKLDIKVAGKVTCSFGVTEYRKGEGKARFFDRVDAALYKAKESGRNQVKKN